jgi:hypothetical protein
MPWRPIVHPDGSVDRYPTLGRTVIAQMTAHLTIPDGPGAGDPLTLRPEQARFIMRFYRVDPLFTGPALVGGSLVNARMIHRAVLSRAKGWGKSPILAGLGITEARGDVVMDGWDAEGQPVGRPWDSLGFRAKVQVIATSEDQTANTWEPLLDMVRHARFLDSEWGAGVDPMDTFVKLPRGRIEFTTSSATSREGGRPVFAVLDQTESWSITNGGVKLAEAVRRNLTKTQGSSVETPNAYLPGNDSVAERSFKAAASKRGSAERILLDHREAPPDTDPEDDASLRAGLEVAYGDSADTRGGWVNLDRVMSDFRDPNVDPQDAQMYYLNQVTAASTAWVTHVEWAARTAADTVVPDRTLITLGFDGSMRRARGVVDSTALIGCVVSTGHVFEVGVWEQPRGEAGKDWEPPRPAIEAAVRAAFARWTVCGFFADPARWIDEVSRWEALYGPRLKVRATQVHPIQWWMTGGRTTQIVKAVENAEHAIREGGMTHDGSYALTTHVLNARRRETTSGITIGKDYPDSPRKIDGAVAMLLAMWARAEAVSKGLARERPKRRSYGF